MLYWAMVFLIIAIVAGIPGFGVVASSISQVLFVIFLVIFVMGLIRRRPPPI